jgi:plastocyanin
MGMRRRYLPLVALLGAATAVLPGIAVSAGAPSATIEGVYPPKWSPMEVTIGPGGTVAFKNTSNVIPHGVVWEGGAPETPSCSGVPVGEGKWATNWEGNCTLSKPGTYDFYCSYHGKSMSGKIVVSSTGTTTEMTMPGTTTTTTTSGNPTGTTPTSPSYPFSPSGPSYAPSATLAGNAVHLASAQRGASVRGSVGIATSGSTLTVELLASSAQVSSAGARQTRVGRVVRAGLPTGRASFTVHLNSRALRALRRRGHLKLIVRMTLEVRGATPAHRTLSVSLRRG